MNKPDYKGAIVEARERLSDAHTAYALAKTGYPELCKYLEGSYEALAKLDAFIEIVPEVHDINLSAYRFPVRSNLIAAKLLKEAMGNDK